MILGSVLLCITFEVGNSETDCGVTQLGVITLGEPNPGVMRLEPINPCESTLGVARPRDTDVAGMLGLARVSMGGCFCGVDCNVTAGAASGVAVC